MFYSDSDDRSASAPAVLSAAAAASDTASGTLAVNLGTTAAVTGPYRGSNVGNIVIYEDLSSVEVIEQDVAQDDNGQDTMDGHGEDFEYGADIEEDGIRSDGDTAEHVSGADVGCQDPDGSGGDDGDGDVDCGSGVSDG